MRSAPEPSEERVTKRDINVAMRDAWAAQCEKSGLEVKVEWQYTHVGQTLHRLKDLSFLPLMGKRDRVTAVLQQDRCVFNDLFYHMYMYNVFW